MLTIHPCTHPCTFAKTTDPSKDKAKPCLAARQAQDVTPLRFTSACTPDCRIVCIPAHVSHLWMSMPSSPDLLTRSNKPQPQGEDKGEDTNLHIRKVTNLADQWDPLTSGCAVHRRRSFASGPAGRRQLLTALPPAAFSRCTENWRMRALTPGCPCCRRRPHKPSSSRERVEIL